ncbi:MAG: hypothetical protein ABIQ95_14535 [Bdellovibrionia bacterium]
MVKGITFFLLLNGLQVEVFAGAKLAVYYGSTAAVRAREKMLRAKLETEDIIVFARSKDFFQSLDQDPVPVVIAPFLIELNRTDYEPILQFTVSGDKEFHYKIATLADKKIEVSNLETITVGLVEEIERPKLKKFFKDNVGLNLAKINSVPKPEDLFPLLVFNAADAIVVSEDNYSKLLKVFTAKTNDIKITTHAIHYPRVYVKKGQESELVKKITNLSTKDINILGFDSVERIVK